MSENILTVHLIDNLIVYRILERQYFLLRILKALIFCPPACSVAVAKSNIILTDSFLSVSLSLSLFGSLMFHPGVLKNLNSTHFIGYSLGSFNLSFSSGEVFFPF